MSILIGVFTLIRRWQWLNLPTQHNYVVGWTRKRCDGIITNVNGTLLLAFIAKCTSCASETHADLHGQDRIVSTIYTSVSCLTIVIPAASVSRSRRHITRLRSVQPSGSCDTRRRVEELYHVRACGEEIHRLRTAPMFCPSRVCTEIERGPPPLGRGEGRGALLWKFPIFGGESASARYPMVQ